MSIDDTTHTQDTHLQLLIELMDSHSLSLKDVESLIAAALVPKAKVAKVHKEEIIYKGIANYTCTTCNYEFSQLFSCNKPNRQVSYTVETCHECHCRLLDYSKEELIEKVLHRKKW